ncbi:MAG: SDR family NAD(P)-dependent oxidoreductase, partial [Alphaproteobacteria bacterium]
MALPPGLSIFDLSGRTALVTGASRGIGWEMARGLAAAGAAVAVVARDEKLLAERKAELAAISGRSAAIAADLADPRQADRVVAEAEVALGRVDILVNNAGGNHRKPLDEFELGDFERVMAINLTSCFAL